MSHPDVPARKDARNAAVWKAYTETDEPIVSIAARHGVGHTRVVRIVQQEARRRGVERPRRMK